MIERATEATFPKDVEHEPLHLWPPSDVPAGASRHRVSSSSAPSCVDDPPSHAPSYASISSRRRGGGGCMVKRVLQSIFCMCKTMVKEVNENRRDIIEMKSHMGLLCDPYHELPEFDDPFAEWDAQDAQATQEEEEPAPHVPAPRTAPRRSRHARDDDEETEEETPQH